MHKFEFEIFCKDEQTMQRMRDSYKAWLYRRNKLLEKSKEYWRKQREQNGNS